MAVNNEDAANYSYKCCVWSQQYGKVQGKMPPGTMTW